MIRTPKKIIVLKKVMAVAPMKSNHCKKTAVARAHPLDGTSAIEKALGKNQRLSDSVGSKKNSDLHEGDGSELNKRAGGEDGEPKELNNKNAQPLTDAQKSEVEQMIKELTKSKHGITSHVEKPSGSTTDAPMTTPPIIHYPGADR